MRINNQTVIPIKCEWANGGWYIYRKKDDDYYACKVVQKEHNGAWRVYLSETDGKPLYLHRIIYAHFCQLPLSLCGKVVHHIDGNKSNNKIENLVALTMSDHTKIHNYIKQGNAKGIEKILRKAIKNRENRLKLLDTTARA